MQKTYFHNRKSIDYNINTKKLSETQRVSEKQVVDINKILNRVKLEKKSEKKKLFFFCSSVLLIILSATTLISVIR